MNSGFFERGGWWVLGQSILMPLVLALGPLCPGESHPAWLGGVAWILFAGGAGFGIGGVWVLGRNRTIFPKPAADSQLVRHGVYRWVRHPLYTSLMLLSLGWAAWWASWPTLPAGAALAVFLDFKARREEAWLRAQFPDYADYTRRVRRFLPGIY
jgi:protein-S-isoprenylcysteine O-methyltransferase Ste14